MIKPTSLDLKGSSDDALLAMLASLDRRRETLSIQQIRAELGLRGVYFTERVVIEQGQRRVVVARRDAVIPSQGALLSGHEPMDWSNLRGERVFVAALFAVLWSFALPSTGMVPAYAVSGTFLNVFYGVTALVALMLLFSQRRNFQLPRLKFWTQQGLLVCNVGLFAFALQVPTMLLSHHWLAKPWQQQGQIVDLKRNSDLCSRSVLIDLSPVLNTSPKHASVKFCELSTADYDQLRPNDCLVLQGHQSAMAITLTQILQEKPQTP